MSGVLTENAVKLVTKERRLDPGIVLEMALVLSNVRQMIVTMANAVRLSNTGVGCYSVERQLIPYHFVMTSVRQSRYNSPKGVATTPVIMIPTPTKWCCLPHVRVSSIHKYQNH